jgi:HEAT repeat protein
LGMIGDQRGVEPLIAASKEGSEYRRNIAISALGMIGDKRAVNTLINALNEKEVGVRLGAVIALGKIKDVRAVDPLVLFLVDKEAEVRKEAAKALGEIGDNRSIKPLLASLIDHDNLVAWSAAEALGKIGYTGPIDPLAKLLLRPDLGVVACKSVATILKKLGWTPEREFFIKESRMYLAGRRKELSSTYSLGTTHAYAPERIPVIETVANYLIEIHGLNQTYAFSIVREADVDKPGSSPIDRDKWWNQ